MIGKKSKIYIAGHKGLVGSALLNQLKKKYDEKNIVFFSLTLFSANQITLQPLRINRHI